MTTRNLVSNARFKLVYQRAPIKLPARVLVHRLREDGLAGRRDGFTLYVRVWGVARQVHFLGRLKGVVR